MSDNSLIARLKKRGCVVCSNERGNDVHHLTTVGSGGADTEDNLITLCRKCHSECHTMGMLSFINKYTTVRWHLEKHKRGDLIEKARRNMD